MGTARQDFGERFAQAFGWLRRVWGRKGSNPDEAEERASETLAMGYARALSLENRGEYKTDMFWGLLLYSMRSVRQGRLFARQAIKTAASEQTARNAGRAKVVSLSQPVAPATHPLGDCLTTGRCDNPMTLAIFRVDLEEFIDLLTGQERSILIWRLERYRNYEIAKLSGIPIARVHAVLRRLADAYADFLAWE